MKKLRNLIYIFIFSVILIGAFNHNVYAAEKEYKHYMYADGYARYGHFTFISDNEFNVIPMMITNGNVFKMYYILYNYDGSNVRAVSGGDHNATDNTNAAYGYTDCYGNDLNCYLNDTIIVDNNTVYFTGYTGDNIIQGSFPGLYLLDWSGQIYITDLDDSQVLSNFSGAYYNAIHSILGSSSGGSTFKVINGEIVYDKNTYYDLELPLNIKVKQKSLIDLWIIELGQDDPLYFTWEQNDPSYTKWTTEIYVSCSGSVKKHWYSIKEEEFETDFIYYTSVDTYKLKYTFDISKDEILDAHIKEQVGDYYSASCKPKFMFRNSWYDSSSGIQHYSNYVYSDNTTPSEAGANPEYNSFELDGESMDSNGISSDNISDSIINDSEYYDGSSSVGADSTTSGAISVLKGVFNDVLQFPDFFKSVLDFLPDTIMTVFGASFIILIGIAFIKIVV